MPTLQGIVVTSPIVPPNTESLHPSHIDIYGKGGFRIVNNLAEMSGIQPARRVEGMLVGISGTNDIYTLVSGIDNTKWTKALITCGHNHTVADITNFGSGVSGLLPINLVYTTGNQNISGVKTFLDQVNADGNIVAPTGTFSKLISNVDFEINGTMNINAAASIIANGPIIFKADKYVVSGAGYFTSGLFVGPTGSATPVSLSGHRQAYSTIDNFCTGVAECVNTPLLAGTGISLSYVNGTGLYINASGGIQISSSSSGFVVKTGINNYTTRYISNGNNINISYADGVSGNPTISLSGNLDSIQNITSTGNLRANSGIFTSGITLNGTGVVLTNRKINTSSGIGGGSDLSSDITIGLTGLAYNLSNINSSGFIATIGNNGVITRTISASGLNILIGSGNGVSGNPIIGLNPYTSGLNTLQSSYLYSNSGYFNNLLQVNGTGVSLTGHSHSSSDITNFNSSVSGLLPSNLVYTTGTQSIDGLKSFSSLITFYNNAEFGTGYQTLVTVGDSIGPGASGAGLMDGTIPLATEYWSGSQNIIHYGYGGGTLSSPRIAVLESNGNVGIGTTTPSGQLHVIGSGLFSGDITANGLFIGRSGTATLPSFEFANDPDTGLFSPSANTIGLATSGVERLRINSSGNIGIGTSSPVSKLQVSGLVTANSGNFTNSLTVNSTGVSISGHSHTASNITNFNSSVSGLLPTGTSNYLSKFGAGGSGLNNSLIFDNGTNVGIGTGTPSETLDVNGTFKSAGFKSYGIGWFGASDGSLGLGVNTNPAGTFDSSSDFVALQGFNDVISTYNPICLTTQNAAQLYLNTDGNVGIGTAAPLSKLQVAGDTSCDGALNITQDISNGVDLTDWRTIINGGSISTYSNINIGFNGAGYNVSINGNGGFTGGASVGIAGDLDVGGNLTFDSFTESVVTIGNSSTSKTISLASGTVQTCTLTSNCTFTMPTATAGKSFSMFLNTGSGNYTASFSGVRWADSAIPTATITASKVDIYSFISDGSFWYGSFSQNYG